MRALMLLAGLISCSVLAQNIETSKPVVCVTPEYAAKVLQAAGETAIFNDENRMTDKQSTVVLLINELTGTWTLLEFQQGLACILGHGVQNQI